TFLVHSKLFFSSRRRHTRSTRDWSSDVCSSDLCRIQPLSAQYFLWFQRMFCQSEIKHLGLIARGDKNICRLDIAVNDALGMSRFQGIGNLYPQVKQQIELQSLFSDALLECSPFQQLHGDKMPPVHLCNLINSADVGMIQGRGSSR